MTTFDDRERGFEAHFAHDEELEFKAQMRRDRALGRWAGELMGLSGAELDAYCQSIVKADMREPGDEDVFQKVVADLAAKDVDILPAAVRAKMGELLAAARAALHAGD